MSDNDEPFLAAPIKTPESGMKPTNRLRLSNTNAFLRRNARWFFWAAVAGTLAKITEEVLEFDLIPVDRSILLFLHQWIPASWLPFVNAVTLTGSSKFLIPLVAVLAVILWLRRQRFEAVQIVLAMAFAGLVIYTVKTAVNRVRPQLWETETYWGSSFPSGHTLGVAAVATACWLAVSRLAPRHLTLASLSLTAWVCLVALSRLILGVHWPTDVAAAACAGLLIAVAINGIGLMIKRRAPLR